MSKKTKTPVQSPEGATGTHTQPEDADKIKLGLYEVPLEFIRPSPTNPRKKFDPEALNELADSIRVKGLISPITVRPVGGTSDRPQFEIVAGERRWRASKIAGIERLPCVVRELNDLEVVEVQIMENDQRVDVTPTEKAFAIFHLHDKGMSFESIARKLGRPIQHIRDFARIALAPERLRDKLDAGEIGTRAAVVICRVPSDQLRREIVDIVFEHDDSPMNAAEIEMLIADRYQVSLQKAKFNTRIPLIPQAGSCDECPRRSFNLAAEDPAFKSLRPDICTDPYCFHEKSKFHLSKIVERARIEGCEVLDPKASAKAMGGLNVLDHSSTYFDLDKPIPAFSDHRDNLDKQYHGTTVRNLLMGETYQRVLLQTEKHDPIWAVRQDEAIRILIERECYAVPETEEKPAAEPKEPPSLRVVGGPDEEDKPSKSSMDDARRILAEIKNPKLLPIDETKTIVDTDRAIQTIARELDRVWKEATETARTKP